MNGWDAIKAKTEHRARGHKAALRRMARGAIEAMPKSEGEHRLHWWVSDGLRDLINQSAPIEFQRRVLLRARDFYA